MDNPFYLTLGQSLPHLKINLDAWKGFDTAAGLFTAHVGAQARQLINSDETLFNRNFLRAYLLATATQLGGTNFYVSANVEYDQDGFTGSNGTFTATGNVGWTRKFVRLEAGTYYQRWRYVYFQQPEELANVRGYYGDASYTFARWMTVRARYSYEVFDRVLQTFTASLSQAY